MTAQANAARPFSVPSLADAWLGKGLPGRGALLCERYANARLRGEWFQAYPRILAEIDQLSTSNGA